MTHEVIINAHKQQHHSVKTSESEYGRADHAAMVAQAGTDRCIPMQSSIN